jgi:hypothetical protein
MSSGLITEGHVKRHTQGKDGHVKMEAETGALLPEAREHLVPPKARKMQRRISERLVPC